jgi:hypothetical protein
MVDKLKPRSKPTPTPDKPKPIGAQELYDAIMKSVVQYFNSEMLTVRRDNEELKFDLKRLRMRNKELEMEIKAMGIAISELGIYDLKVFGDMKNMIHDKIGVTDRLGNIKGRNEIRRFNLTPSSDKILLQQTKAQ